MAELGINPQPWFCEECKHPHVYHHPDKGCLMPIGAGPCGCGKPDPSIENVAAFIEEVTGVVLYPWQRLALLQILKEEK